MAIQNTESNVVDQQFLDSKQYRKTGILRYEYIFGDGFISTGGITTTEKIFDDIFPQKTSLRPNPKVLDVGCGIGGGDMYILNKLKGSRVCGIDLSSNCIDIAKSKYSSPNLEFLVADALIDDFGDDFDLIYSRDTILHIQDKKALFDRFFKLMRPGGYVLITDYMAAPKSEWDDEFKSYVAERSYSLTTVEEYAELLESAGFSQVCALDTSDWFGQVLRDELTNLNTRMNEFLETGLFTQSDLSDLESGWTQKIDRNNRGLQKWGLFIFQKPL